MQAGTVGAVNLDTNSWTGRTEATVDRSGRTKAAPSRGGFGAGVVGDRRISLRPGAGGSGLESKCYFICFILELFFLLMPWFVSELFPIGCCWAWFETTQLHTSLQNSRWESCSRSYCEIVVARPGIKAL